ncbi:hypothetical protein HN011_002549 [Eciton burchellii]|nr:hypothetical protein HN011_002549 [Eciton burchellii]
MTFELELRKNSREIELQQCGFQAEHAWDLMFKHVLSVIQARIIGSSSRGSAKSIELVTYQLFHYKATASISSNDG